MNLIFRENIRTLIKEKNLSIREFAALIDEKTSRINDVLQGKQRPPFDMLEKIITTCKVDAHWLITGEKRSPDAQENKNNSDIDDYALIPMFDVEVSAGYGAIADGVCEPSMHLAYRKDWLQQRGLFAKDLSVVTARGDSMEPTINNRDTILVNRAKTNPRDGYIYVIRAAGILWVKRIQRQLDGNLLLISDNPSYPPMLLDAHDRENMEIIGQVVSVSKDLI